MKMLRCRLVLMGLLVLVNAAKCIAAGTGSPLLVSPEMLKTSNLQMLWQNALPIKEYEGLERLYIFGNRLCILSDRNYMFCLNREKGNMIFSTSVGMAGFPVLGLESYKEELFSIIGNKLVELNLQSGTKLGAKRLGVSAACPAARNDSYFYIAGADRRIHTLRAEDKVQVFEVAADNASAVTSVIADDKFVVFATDAGNVISFLPDRPERLWQFDAAGGIVGPVVRDGKWLFFASKDTNVYKLNILTGKFVWKYQAGAVLDKAPRVGEKLIYQYAREGGLAAVDKESGKLVWQLAQGTDVLAEDDGKAYVITNTGRLIVMDNNKARQLYSVELARVSKYAANMADARIYITDDAGRIACLVPIQ